MGEDTHASHADARRVDFSGINALSSRAAGYSVALKCLEVQAHAESLDPTLRSDTELRLHPEAWSWYQGALGEIAVGKTLAALGPEWFVRHSVPIGAGSKDVDHLVIGPGGVFAINTKHHAGASVWVGDHVLRVNGTNKHHVAAGRSDALDVARRLSEKVGFPVPVVSVVAFFNARSLSDARAPENRDVRVVNATNLVSWLGAQTTPLGPTKLQLIKLAAEEPETWHVDPHAADTFRTMQRFERLVERATVAPPNAASAVGAPAAVSGRGRPRKPTRPERARHPAPARSSSSARSRSRSRSRSREASERRVIQYWLYGALMLGVTIWGTRQAAECSVTTGGTTQMRCAVVEGVSSLIPLGWWLAGVFCSRRSRRP